MRDLQIGAEILQEALTREAEKEERHERAFREGRAAEAARVANVCLFNIISPQSAVIINHA